jgi:hypothetical protein
MRKALWFFLLASMSCASQPLVRRVQEFRDARDRGDFTSAQAYIAPGARLWYEEKKGDGEAYVLRGGSWDHWDTYFHGRNRLTDWRTTGRSVTATAYETNDFMQLLEWQAPPYTITWWFNKENRISGVLIKGGGKARSRLEEFREWARKNHPEELEYLMPKGRLDPTGDRPERWHTILEEWRNQPRARSDTRPDGPSANAAAPRAWTRSSAAAWPRACRPFA